MKGEFMSYTRFAIYYLPPEGALADFGAAWLGWDCVSARDSIPHDVPGLHDVTMTPRKYGFHGTLKPPFRLAEGTDVSALQDAVSQMAAACAPAQSDGLALTELGRFLALTPVGDTSGIARVAATCVEALDAFRAPPPEAELERRRKARLSERQEALLQRWGYPYVMDEFRFHLTLTGRLNVDDIAPWTETARAHLPPLPAPFVMDEVALVGEREDGRFELIQRYTLNG
jgi:putative phosphonate metabolism protein